MEEITLEGDGPTSMEGEEWSRILGKLVDRDGPSLLVMIGNSVTLPVFTELPDGEPSSRRIALLANDHGEEAVKSLATYLAPVAEVRIFEIPEADAARFWLSGS